MYKYCNRTVLDEMNGKTKTSGTGERTANTHAPTHTHAYTHTYSHMHICIYTFFLHYLHNSICYSIYFLLYILQCILHFYLSCLYFKRIELFLFVICFSSTLHCFCFCPLKNSAVHNSSARASPILLYHPPTPCEMTIKSILSFSILF